MAVAVVGSPKTLSALGMVAPTDLEIKLPAFEGSLSALFNVVRERKIDLMDVPLFPICESYFKYILTASLENLDEAAAALSALAYLLERKAWLLLPVDEPEPEVVEDDLTSILPTAQEYRVIVEALTVWRDERADLFFRSADAGPDPYELPFTISNVTALDLAKAFERVLERAEPNTIEPLNKPRKSLQDQMALVLRILGKEFVPLTDLMPERYTRTEAVYWFLAVLELMRLGQVVARVEGDTVEFALP